MADPISAGFSLQAATQVRINQLDQIIDANIALSHVFAIDTPNQTFKVTLQQLLENFLSSGGFVLTEDDIAQDITGIKTFLAQLAMNEGAVIANDKPIYFKNALGESEGLSSKRMLLDGINTWAFEQYDGADWQPLFRMFEDGVTVFANNAASHAPTPTLADHLTRKDYVDAQIDGTTKFYTFTIQGDGSQGGLPSGWSSTRTGGGQYTITHNLGWTPIPVACAGQDGGNSNSAIAIFDANGTSFRATASAGGGFRDHDINVIIMY